MESTPNFEVHVPRRKFKFAVIGGGIAGVSCVEQILEFDSEAEILLISSAPVVKEVSNVTRLTKTLQDFVIVEKSLKSFKDVHQSVIVIQDYVNTVEPKKHLVSTANNGSFEYEKLCICTGASPKVLFEGNENVIGIRDTESVQDLTKRLINARRVLLLGNGGIATELVYELQGVDVIWSIKDSSISSHYLDQGAAEFFVKTKINEAEESESSSGSKAQKRRKYALAVLPSESPSSSGNLGKSRGSALGPDWHEGFCLQGSGDKKQVIIETETECTCILSRQEYLQHLKSSPDTIVNEEESEWPVYALLSNGKIYGCNIIISATGVKPNCGDYSVQSDPEKGIFVNCRMETSQKDIYAAGDVCFANWTWSPHWFQMRLWTQARQMGLLAGKNMYISMDTESQSELDIEPDFMFEVFSHVTRFFGFKVVLLGLYNANGLQSGSYEYLLRYTKNLEYIKVVLQNSRMKGAILIGETGLEETFENLIMNQLDLIDIKIILKTQHLHKSKKTVQDWKWSP
ncbi:unnamed protein product [Allacma fusca]|uniref:FAD/NAD(P)-binding domain-containing protein n=1 Tax=Allacma fusca TaxID=39272 RepID=A0A8J2JZK8_9HEXA|nr:unnamed protein product [Allacma fusca]